MWLRSMVPVHMDVYNHPVRLRLPPLQGGELWRHLFPSLEGCRRAGRCSLQTVAYVHRTIHSGRVVTLEGEHSSPLRHV